MMHSQFGQMINDLQRRYTLVVIGRMIENSLVFASLFSLLALGMDRTGLLEISLFRVWPVTAVAAAAAITIGLMKKQSFLMALVDADRRFDTKDLMSSAWEVFSSNTVSIFSETLLRNAAELIAQTGPRNIFPLKLSWSLLLVPVCAGVGFFLMLTIPTTSPPDIRAGVDMAADLEGQVTRFAKGLEDQDDKQTQKKRFQQIQKTAAQMLTGSRQARKAAARSFSGLLETIEDKNEQDLEQLKEQLNMESDDQGMNIPNPVPGPGRQQTAVDLEDLKETIKEAFDEHVPEHLSRQMDNIEANRDLAKYIEELLKKYGQSPEDARDEIDASETEKASGNESDQAEQEPDSPAGGPGGQGDPDSLREGDIPGSFTPEERKKETSEPAEAKGRMEMDKPGDFDKGAFGYAVKTLTGVNRIEKPVQEIRKDYIRQNEAVMLKERIPPAYRESIRDYFLSIGLQGE